MQVLQLGKYFLNVISTIKSRRVDHLFFPINPFENLFNLKIVELSAQTIHQETKPHV